MRWPKAYVDLVLRFAHSVTDRGAITPDRALIDWTPLYLNFGLDRSFDPANPTWQKFLAGYQAAHDSFEWTYSFCLARALECPPTPYGCFSYHYEPESRAI